MYDVYNLSKNKSFVKKEIKYGYSSISVRIKNLTDSGRTLTSENFRIYVNERELTISDKIQYLKEVGQHGAYGAHMLWGLSMDYFIYSLWKKIDEGDEMHSGKKPEFRHLFTSASIFVVLMNSIMATNANSKLKKNISENDIYGKNINPGETIYGIIILNNANFDPLVFKYLDK